MMNPDPQAALRSLHLSVAKTTYQKASGTSDGSFDPSSFDFDTLSALLRRHAKLPGVASLMAERGLAPRSSDSHLASMMDLGNLTGLSPRSPQDGAPSELLSPRADSIDSLESTLRRVFTSQSTLEDFVLKFSERLFLDGRVKLKGLHDDTAALLREIAPQIEVIRGFDAARAPKKVLALLEALDARLLHFISESVDAPEGSKGASRLSGTNYWALNEQHKQIATAIKRLEQSIQVNESSSLMKKLTSQGLLTQEEASALPEAEKRALRSLVKEKIVHQAVIPGGKQVYAFAHGEVDSRQFELVFPKSLREQIGHALHQEFQLKYSGKVRAIGIGDIRASGVPSLLDRYRVKKVARELGLESSHIVLALKYFASLKLLKNDQGAFSLSPAGDAVGLGFRAVRLVRRIENGRKDSPITIAFESYLERAIESQRSWVVPTYEFATKEGGLPRCILVDRWQLPNARFNRGVYEYTQSYAKNEPSSLLIMGNMLQGLPSIDKRQARTAVKGYEGMDTQLSLLKELWESFGLSCINILGPNIDRSGELRAFEQVLREKGILGLGENADESQVAAVRQSKNDQYQYTIQRELALEITDWAEFINRVVFPLETKLGREMHSSIEVHTRTGIEMNELEILRDLSGILVQHGSLDAAYPDLSSQYGDFLEEIQRTDPNYLEFLEHILFSSTEELSSSEMVSRAGAQIQMLRERDGAKGLKINIIPDMNYGKAVRSNPTTSMIGFLKSAANRGDKDLADVNFVMNAGEPWISITGTGKWVISPGTMEYTSTEPRDLFYDTPQDYVKKRRTMMGKPPETGVLVVSGGVDDGTVTHALTFEFITPKLLQVLEDNKRRGIPARSIKIYSTSDWQIGSPTMKEKMAIVGLLLAIKEGADEILLNGDIQQGMNYLRYCVEAGLVENPLIGVEDQSQYIVEIMNLVTEYIGKKHRTDPNFKIPKFRINIGNHEANTQANKGLQGNWLLTFLEEKLTSYFHALLDDRDAAEALVLYPRKYVAHDGTPVDYSLSLLDYSAETGFRIEATHYDGAGAKGSSFTPPIASAARAVHSLELQEPHILMRAHFHTPAWTTVNGIVCGIFGANAGQSGFERHLSYTDSQPGNGMITLSSEKVPSFMQLTERYLEIKEHEVLAELHSLGIMRDFSSFDDFCRDRRRKVSLRVRGATDFSSIPRGLPHDAESPNRRIA